MNRSNIFLRVVPCLLAITSAATATAAEPAADRDAAFVRPLIGETTAVIIKLDPTRLALPDLSAAAEQMRSEAEQLHLRLPLTAEAIEAFRAATSGQPVYASIGIPLSQTEWPIFFFLRQTPGVDPQRPQDFLRAMGIELTSVVRGGMIIMAEDGRSDLAKMLDALAVSPREQLDDAFSSVASYPIQILLMPPDYIRRTVVELMPQLPRHLAAVRATC
jgi:hypothetical protein